MNREQDELKGYCVVRYGGNPKRIKPYLGPKGPCDLIDLNLTKQEAYDIRKLSNSRLTENEKSIYLVRYSSIKLELVNLNLDDVRDEIEEIRDYSVILYNKSITSKTAYVGTKHRLCSLTESNLTKEEARLMRNRMNRKLSKGEKEYYGIKYSMIQTEKLKKVKF